MALVPLFTESLAEQREEWCHVVLSLSLKVSELGLLCWWSCVFRLAHSSTVAQPHLQACAPGWRGAAGAGRARCSTRLSFCPPVSYIWRRRWHPTPVLLPGKSHGRRSLVGCIHGVARSWTRLSDFTFTFHFHALEKEMSTHSSVLAWRIPGTGEPGGLPSMGSHRVRHD